MPKKRDNEEGLGGNEKADPRSNEAGSETEQKRKTVRRLLVGSGIVAGGQALPEKWVTPTLHATVLPAHAQTTPGGGNGGNGGTGPGNGGTGPSAATAGR